MAIRRTLAEFSDDIATADIADDAVTGDKLANDIAISTTGAITTTGAFTSIGIDDNASGAVSITIDSDENVGIGTTSPTTALHIKDVATSASGLTIESDGASSKYGRIRANTNGDFIFQSDAGNQECLRMMADGKIGIGI